MLNYNNIPQFLTPEILKKYLQDKIDSTIDICIDEYENVVLHKLGRGEKVLVLLPVETEEVFPVKFEEDVISFVLKDNIDEKSINDSYVISANDTVGVIKKDEKTSFIEKLGTNNYNIRECFQIPHNSNCKGDKLYGRNIKLDISINSAVDTLNISKSCDKDICFTMFFSENAAKSLLNNKNYDSVILLKYGNTENDFALSKGCGIVYKDGTALISNKMTSFCTNAADDINYQPYFGTKGALLESLLVTSSNLKICSLCIPIKYMGSNCEIANLSDIENTNKLLANIIKK